MEFKVTEYKLPEAIKFNFEELKNELAVKTEAYKNMVYAPEDIKAAKSDRAELNRLKKALNDERLNRQKEYMKPFDAFKKQVDEVISIVDSAVKNIDEQVKAFESKIKEEKSWELRGKFDEINTLDWLIFDQIFDTKWLNASVSVNTAAEDMKIIISSIETNLGSLTGLEHEFEAKEYYMRTLSLADALNENKRLIDLDIKRAEMEQKKEAPVIEVSKLEETVSMPKEWMTLNVCINESDYDALAEWLDKQGIEWSIT